MANDEEQSAAIVREYFVKNGGKVKRDDLFDHFRSLLDKFDDQGISKNRFGDIVNSLASLQNIEGEKYFVLKKAKNGTPTVLLRRPGRQMNQRKDKGASLPTSMRNFRLSAADDTFGNIAIGDTKGRPSAHARGGFRSDSVSSGVGMRRNTSDTSITENGQANDSGVDTAASSLQSESPGGSRQSSFSKGSEYDQLSQQSGDTGIFNEEDYYEHDVPSHVLTSFEKSWMMSAMTGNKSEIICQLEEDPRIITFKDFIMTALHWAAKQGYEDLVRLLVDRGAEVNTKSNGYTPLHLATMHGKVTIINILVDEFHANVHVRDHSGKEPKDVVTKNSPEEIRKKLADPTAASDSSNQSGLSKYMETKSSPKLKPKLKAGASFRLLKSRSKKLRRSNRPVIEHFDSTGRQRLQSTLKSDEREFYKMQRTNSGSLFPTSFYSTKRASQSEQGEGKTASVDGGGEVGTNSEEIEQKQRERLLSRSYSENEFRNLSRISESDPQESSGDHKNPSGSLSSSTTVISGQNPFGSEVNHSNKVAVFEGDKMKRRSYSDNNLYQHASIQDELATRLTMGDKPKENYDRPHSVFAEDAANLEKTAKPRSENEDMLTLKVDSSPGEKSKDLFRGDELATLMTLPSTAAEASTQSVGKPKILVKANGDVPGFGRKSAVKIFTESEEKKAKPSPVPNEEMKAKESSGLQPTYSNNKIIPKFNNNYKQVSEILTAEEEKNVEATEEEPTSPVRPPRKKDKSKKAFHVDENDDKYSTCNVTGTTDNAKNVNVNAPPEQRQAKYNMNPLPGYKGDEIYLGLSSQFSNSLNDYPYRLQGHMEQLNVDHTKQTSQGIINQQADMNQEPSREYKNQDYTKWKSDSFPVLRAHSDENIFNQYPELNTRRKSEGFLQGTHERISAAEFLKPAPEYFRRKSEGFTDQPRSKSFTSLRKSKDLLGEPRSESLTDRRRSGGFTIQKEVSLDHPRRRTIHNPAASMSNQTESHHILPEVLLDSTRRRASSEYSRTSQGDPGFIKDSPEDFGTNTQVNQRVPPPYRPPPALIKDPSPDDRLYPENQGNRRPPTRPNYMSHPPPTSKEPPPYRNTQETPSYVQRAPLFSKDPPYNRKSQDVSEYSFSNPDSRSGHLPLKGNSLSNNSSEDLSKHTRSVSEPYPPSLEMSPTAPPRRHRVSIPSSSEVLDYPPSEVTPTAPPRKHRGSPRRLSDDVPTRIGQAGRPNYPPPSLQSSVPPPRANSQGGEDYTLGREVSLDHPEKLSRNFVSDDTTVLSASSYYPSEYDSFQSPSSNYRQSGPNEYNTSERGNFVEQSSNYRQPASSEFYPSDSSYRHSSIETSIQYPAQSSHYYPSEYSYNSEPTDARDTFAGNGSPSIRRRSAVDTTTRVQSPPEEVVLARSITSDPERFPVYSGEFGNDRRDSTDYIPRRKPLESPGEAYITDRRNGPYYENEFNAASAVPRYDGYTNIDSSRPEQNVVVESEPGFIVAKQMTSHEGMTEARPLARGSREDMNTLPGTLREEMKSKWFSSSSDGSNESSENKNKYRMTSII